tara:strand:+ start:741 stop:1910 length:1170 start_codon:yes stop_codon:yes gene_type:complete
MADQLPSAHSILGASGSHRWMTCPGSVTLAQGMVDEPSEFAAEGTAAHALGEATLLDGSETWTKTGMEFAGYTASPDMVRAVDEYVRSVRTKYPNMAMGENAWVERTFHAPEIHAEFYGTCDFVFWDAPWETLHIWDYKHGAGVVVEADNNSQLKYYAAGALYALGIHNQCRNVVLHVAQPRGWHRHGGIRDWSLTARELTDWLWGELVPAMNRALTDNTTKAGEHCRFCPVRSHQCPEILRLYKEFKPLAEKIEKEGAAELTDEQVSEFMEFGSTFKIAMKAAEQTVFNRLNRGSTIAGYKLAPKRANRAWKEGAEKKLKATFGDKAFEPRKLATPAAVEKLPKGGDFVKRYANKPDAGLTVVRVEDPRPEVSKTTKSHFKPVGKPSK